MNPIAVKVDNVTRTFGGLHALDGVSLEVPLGQRRALIGPNGAGKTTLFNCIAGSLSPSSGRVFLFEKEVTQLAEYQRIALGIGRAYQITNVFHQLSVLENVLIAEQGTKRQKWILYRPLEKFKSKIDLAIEKLYAASGTEKFFFLPSKSRLSELENLYAHHTTLKERTDIQSSTHAILDEISRLNKQRRSLAAPAEKPVRIAGKFRAPSKTNTATLPDITPFAKEIVAQGFYSKTFTIDHR